MTDEARHEMEQSYQRATRAFDVGSYDDEGIAVRQAVDLGLLDGPRVIPCGRIISATSPGGATRHPPAWAQPPWSRATPGNHWSLRC